jgi:ribonuclease P/MRP protein subunit RPP40
MSQCWFSCDRTDTLNGRGEDLCSVPVPPQVFDPESGPPLLSVDVTPEMVGDKIKILKPGASGPDKISPRLLRELADQLALPISIIFNKSLAECAVPKDWKLSNVTSIFKKGDKTVAANYRPISLTCLICRILESILRDRILLHLQEYQLIRKSQHGFLPHLSCLTNLLEFLEEVTRLIDEGHSIDVLFLDFSKAFDKVPHVRLISKVKAHGVLGDIANWIEEWLKDRKQRVVLNGKESRWTDVLSGVPQGSVLGPILFLIYINDIDCAIDCVTTFMKKFADDTKLGTVTDNVSQCEKLQEQINSLIRWAEIWQMSFNIDKCIVMHLGLNNLRHSYHMNGSQMKITECEKDIGVYMHSSLKPSFHIAESVKKANKALGILLRCYTFRDKFHFIHLYKTYVRFHLEYAVQAWSPWLKQDIENIESVQKRAVRNCHGLQGASYEEKLKEVGLTTLVDRRCRGDMLETFKILNGINDVDYHTWFTKVDEQHQLTRQAVAVSADGTITGTQNLVKPKSRLDLRKNFFSCRVVNNWNNLPVDVREAGNVDEFKKRYDFHMTGK